MECVIYHEFCKRGENMEIKPEKMVQYFKEIEAFSEKFPMMKMKDVNFIELGKHWGHPPMEVYSSAVFLDMMHEINRNSEKGFYIDMNEIKKIKVIKRKNDWVFQVITKENKTLKLKHRY